jgi:hypothetical protein
MRRILGFTSSVIHVPVADTALLSQQIPGSQPEVVGSSVHLPYEEPPAAFMGAFAINIGFIERVDAW